MGRVFEWQRDFDGSPITVDPVEQGLVYRRFHEYVYRLLQPHVQTDGLLQGAKVQRNYSSLDLANSGLATDVRISVGYRTRNLALPAVRLEYGAKWPQLFVRSVYSSDSRQAGAICRDDQGTEIATAMLHQNLAHEAVEGAMHSSSEEALKHRLARAGMHGIESLAEAREYDRRIGLNEQPIGIGELIQLISVVESAEPY